MFPQQKTQAPKIKKENEGCVVDIKKTKSGKRISFKGKCSKEQMQIAQQENESSGF